MSTWLDHLDRRYTDRVRLLVEILPMLAQEPGFALKGGTAINPLSSRCGSLLTCSQRGKTSSGEMPAFASSPPRLISKKIGNRFPSSPATPSSLQPV